jgi:hypothetical protein
MQDQLQKAIKLAKKTGDRLIVFDPNHTDLTYVVMTIDDYERMVEKRSEVKGLTEQELIDKINRDIAIWKSDQDYNENIDTDHIRSVLKERFSFNKKQGGYYSGATNKIEQAPVSFEAETTEKEIKNDGRNKWSIPPTRKRNAEEIIDEDTQYLEEITF